MQKLRFTIALWVNKHFDDVCWAELVLWAINWDMHDFSEIFEMRGTAGKCQDQPYFYCGKCEETGYHAR
jgi:hypothetical protein